MSSWWSCLINSWKHLRCYIETMSQSGPKGVCVITPFPCLAGCSYELIIRELQATLVCQYCQISQFHGKTFCSCFNTSRLLGVSKQWRMWVTFLYLPDYWKKELKHRNMHLISEIIGPTKYCILKMSLIEAKCFFKAFKVIIFLLAVIIRLPVDALCDTLYYSWVMPCRDKVMVQTLAHWRLQAWAGGLYSSSGHWSVEQKNELTGMNLLFYGFCLIFVYSFSNSNPPTSCNYIVWSPGLCSKVFKEQASSEMFIISRHHSESPVWVTDLVVVHGIVKMGSDFPLPHREGTLRLASALGQSEDVALHGGYWYDHRACPQKFLHRLKLN